MGLQTAKQAGQAPAWLSDEGWSLMLAYCQEGETPLGLYTRLAKTAAKHIGEDFQEAFFQCLWCGWLSPSTPVAANLGATKANGKPRGLPVSCFGLKPDNSINSIFTKAHEAAMLSKYGGGLGICLDELIGRSPVTHWARLYDTTAQIVSQGGLRRGAVALYLDTDHPDIEAFLHAKDMLEGDPREKITSNIAITIGDNFMARLKAGEKKASELFAKVLELRMKYGSPYLFFRDNANRARGADYEALGLFISASQLCNEICLYSDAEHTYTCVLSSLNIAKYSEWSEAQFEVYGNKWTVPQLGIAFLDAVNSEFIEQARKLPGYAPAVRFAEKSRALGLGVLGWHAFLQDRNLPFDSEEAHNWNKHVFSKIASEAKQASLRLGKMFGVPEWCQTSGQRNSHLLAIAPTLANSVLCSAGSAGIEPIASNCYVYQGANGSFLRKNALLQQRLAEIDCDTDAIWQSIAEHDGSIQHLRSVFASQYAKTNSVKLAEQRADELLAIFRTAYELDQFAIIKQAADRQVYIDQGQSVNLFIAHDAPAELIFKLHIKAYTSGLKGLYYVRSTSPHKRVHQIATTMQADQPVSAKRAHLQTRPGCIWCVRAKALLEQHAIGYTEELKTEGTVPQIWLDNEHIGGFTDLKALLEPDLSKTEPISCTGCDG